jgi:hypothetical protein
MDSFGNKMISVTVNVTDSNSLNHVIAENKRQLINQLAIVGKFYVKSDAPILQSMCNVLTESGCRSGGQLEELDLSKAEIGYGKQENSYHLSTPAFKDCITLKRIILSCLHSCTADVFRGCTSLESIELSCTVSNTCYWGKNGILYQVGEWSYIDFKVHYFKDEEQILTKYPSAKREIEEIDFARCNRIADYAFEDFQGHDLFMDNVPPACSQAAFYNVDISQITLHVPHGTHDSYWSHPVWGQFKIEEMKEGK